MRRMLNNLSTDHTALPLPAFIIILFVCVSAREATITTYYNTSLTHSQHRKNKTRNNKYMRDLLLSFFIRSFFRWPRMVQSPRVIFLHCRRPTAV